MSRKATLLLTVSLLSGVFIPPALADLAARPQIESMPAEQAVAEFTAKTQISVLYAPEDLAHLVTSAVSGLQAIDALGAMFRGLPIQVIVKNGNVFYLEYDASASDVVTIRGSRSPTSLVMEPYSPMPIGTALSDLPVNTIPALLRDDPVIGGGVCEDGLDSSRESRTNSAHSCGVNTRGLGPNQTLMLFNGMRIAAGGSADLNTDVSHFPLMIIDHIEIYPDVPTVPFGADAIAGTVNIVPIRDLSGSLARATFSPARNGAPGERDLGFGTGFDWHAIRGLVAAEWYSRGAMLADSRSQASADLTPLGGPNNGALLGFPGTMVLGSQTWAIPNHPFTAGELVPGTINLYDFRRHTDILPEQEHTSLYVNAHLSPPDKADLTFEGLLTRRTVESSSAALGMVLTVPTSNAFYVNPRSAPPTPYEVLYSFAGTLGPSRLTNVVWDGNAAISLRVRLAQDWTSTLRIGFTQETQSERMGGELNTGALEPALADPDPHFAFDPYGNRTSAQTLRNITASWLSHSDSRNWQAKLVAEGPLPFLSPKSFASVGLDLRTDTYASSQTTSETQTLSTHAARNVGAMFALVCTQVLRTEAHACGNHFRAARGSIDLTAGSRVEQNSDLGARGIPYITALVVPLRNLAIQTTWARSFKAASVADMNESTNMSSIMYLGGPHGTQVPVLTVTGNNSSLRPINGESVTATLSYRPGALPAAAELHYFHIDLRDQIEAPGFNQTPFSDPQARTLLTVDPTQAQRQALCKGSTFLGSMYDCLNQPVTAIYDLRLMNQPRSTVSGLDFNARTTAQAGNGTWTNGVTATYYLQYTSRPPSQQLRLMDTPGYPLEFRSTLRSSWIRRGFGVEATIAYSGGYRDFSSVPPHHVSSWTTADLVLSWSLPDTVEHARRWRTFASLQNVFNTHPPIVYNPVGLGYDPVNANLLGRYATIGFETFLQ